MEVMRVYISDGTRPVYVQMMLTTGTLMAGKMSTGVRRIMTGAIRNSSSARTTKVYGRESATRTIHIEDLNADACIQPYGPCWIQALLENKSIDVKAAAKRQTRRRKPNSFGCMSYCRWMMPRRSAIITAS